MALDDHRNPNGTYDGVGVMAEVTGLPRDEIRALAEQVKANHAKLAGCLWHEFEGYSDSVVAAPTPAHRMRYRCRHCQGEVDASAYHWHQQGRRPMPVGEPQPALGYPCKGGPLDGRMLAHNGTVYHVSDFDNAPALHAPHVTPSPHMPPIKTAEYRLQQVGHRQLAWVFQGWPE